MVSACATLEPFALQVLDDSMAPDLPAGSIVVVDPGEPVEENRIVLVERAGELLLRRVRPEEKDGSEGIARFDAPAGPGFVLAGDWRRAVRGVVTRVHPPR